MEKDLDNISDSLGQAEEFNTRLGEFLDKNLTVDNKTLRQWRKRFHISLPDDINFSTLVQKGAEISRKYQEAAFHRDQEGTQLAVLEQARTSKYNTAYDHIRREHQETYGKRLAADSCKAAALLEITDIEDAISNQKVVSDFWHKTCAVLTETRKHLELMGQALSGEARVHRDFIVKGEKDQ